MVRIANLASNTSIVNQLQHSQQVLYDYQYQVSFQQKSETYGGIARETQRLLNLENTDERITRYNRNNDIMEMRLNAKLAANEAILKEIRDFRGHVDNFIQGDTTNTTEIEKLQDFAYTALQQIEAYLDTRIDGQYLYAGSKTDTTPVDFAWTSKADFQTMYDGITTTYPTTRTEHLEYTLDNADIGAVTFSTAGTITSDVAGGTEFAKIGIGTKFTVYGANDSSNDQTYTVTGNTGTVLTVTPVPGANDGGDTTYTINAQSYYYGDNFTRTHRLDDDRTMDLDITAENPAFEKAIRAMGIILQGDLVNNTSRANDAHYLLGIALEEPQDGTPPYGTETTGNMEEIGFQMGYKLTLIKDTRERFTDYSTFLKKQIASIENVDPAEAIAQFNAQSTALEASYKAFAQIQRMSLSEYL